MIKFAETISDGYTLRGILNEVENSKGLVVMFHGFTGHMNENGYLFKELSTQLAEHGFSSIRFDYRGNGISDGRFNEMTFDTVLADARNIVKYAKSLNINEKLIILGFSMGGAAASMVAKEFEEDLEKLVLLAPAASMMTSVVGRYRNNPNVIWYDENNIDMGGYLMSKAFIDSFDDLDLYQNTNLNVPVIIIHGEKDMAVPVEYGKKYSELYPNCEFYMVPESEHCFQRMCRREFVNSHIIEFLEK
jgi:pimeloyl-ACP methyl ester carboxylesterase